MRNYDLPLAKLFKGDNISESIIRTKSKEFAKNIIFLCRKLTLNHTEFALINQLLRAGTSIGANIYEAQYAQSTKDFISKLKIALKECNETAYWLELLFETNSITNDEFKVFKKDYIELRRMIVSSITTLKKKA